jgi:hypothetical protein
MSFYKKPPELPELHTRLYQVLPEHPPISSRVDQEGIFKAIDATGNVYLVSFTTGLTGAVAIEKHRVMDYDALLRASSV